MSVNAREVGMSGLSHKSWWLVGLIVGLAIVVVAVVQAAIPDPSGVIHACYRSNGNLRLVDKSSCTSNETPLTWNQTGPHSATNARLRFGGTALRQALSGVVP